MADTKLLKKLMDTYGVSGSEEEVRSLIMKELKPYVSDMKVDRAGNLIAHQKGPKPTVMLAAHMDEVGLIAKEIDNTGKIYLERIGGLGNIVLIGQRVLVQAKKGWLPGVISTKEISEGLDPSELPEDNYLFVDTGLNKKELEANGVKTGNFINLVQENMLLNKKTMSGKSVDDRLGCYILIELAKKCKKFSKNEMFFVFTVQEEMGLYGAKTSAYEVAPDWGIAVDVTDADDVENEKPTKTLGGGPTITIKDAQLIGNKCINGWLKNIAEKKKIPLQFDVSDAGTTDALSIYLSRGGVPATVVGVPIRNMHSTVSLFNLQDVDNAIKILSELLKNPPKTCLV